MGSPFFICVGFGSVSLANQLNGERPLALSHFRVLFFHSRFTACPISFFLRCLNTSSDDLSSLSFSFSLSQTISCPAHSCDILVDDNTVM